MLKRHKTAKKAIIRPMSPYFTTLSEVGLHCHRIPIYETCVDKDDWLTATLCKHVFSRVGPKFKSKCSINNHLHDSLDCCLSCQGHHNLSQHDINKTKSISSVKSCYLLNTTY